MIWEHFKMLGSNPPQHKQGITGVFDLTLKHLFCEQVLTGALECRPLIAAMAFLLNWS